MLPPAAMTSTSPGWARSRALWNIRLSPAGHFTVKAVPSRGEEFMGHSSAWTAERRFMQSSMLATGIPRKASTRLRSGRTIFFLILHPTDMIKSFFLYQRFKVIEKYAKCVVNCQ